MQEETELVFEVTDFEPGVGEVSLIVGSSGEVVLDGDTINFVLKLHGPNKILGSGLDKKDLAFEYVKVLDVFVQIFGDIYNLMNGLIVVLVPFNQT